MGYTIISNCPRCGAPIYVESPYWSIMPPAPIRSCACFPAPNYIITNTTTTAEKPYQFISASSKEVE